MSVEGKLRKGGSRVIFCRSNPVDPDPRVEKEAAALSEAGYPVSIIAWDRTGTLPEKESWDGISIHRLPIQARFAQGLGNIWPLLRWLIGLAGWLIRHRGRYDLIHACDFDTVGPALLSKILFGKQVVYDIFDFYADHLRATPGWIKGIIRRMDFLAIRWADAVILVDKIRMGQIQGSKPKRITIINNSPRDVYHQMDGEELDVEKDLVLIYVGLLQVERGLLELLDVLTRQPSWSLHLAGFGGDETRIVGRARELENVRWYGRISYQRALELTAGSDVSIATYDPSIPNHRYASPNKIYEAMMLAKPVIVARHTNMDRMVERWDCGRVVTYGDPWDLENALQELAADQTLRRELGANGRKAYESHYSWSTMQGRLLALYEEINGRGKREGDTFPA